LLEWVPDPVTRSARSEFLPAAISAYAREPKLKL
jgi:hypothetical protein